MKTDKDLNYRLFIQHTYGFTRSPFERELGLYKMVQSGDTDGVKRHYETMNRDFLEGKGVLSDDPLRNLVYHFVTSVALVSRFCIEGGLGHDTAYTLADIYIQRADKCRSEDTLKELFREMQLDFAERMKELKKENVISLHVRKCIDYIYEHLQENLTLAVLADHAGLNPSYLSKLFSRETGMSVKVFITRAKVATAENLLKYSDFSCLDISTALGFSSQSAFISVFRKYSGMTPVRYRELHYRNITDENNDKEQKL